MAGEPGDLPSRDVRAKTAGRGVRAQLSDSFIFAVTVDVNREVSMYRATPRKPGTKFEFGIRNPILRIYSIVGALNVAAWVWAFVAFRETPALLGIALVIYSLGLRHAVDADHIAAIDNVTRKLMREGKRPVSAGLFFALGHSTVVTIVTAAVAFAAIALEELEAVRGASGVIGTAISALFLLAIAIMNLFIFRSVFNVFRHVRAGGAYVEEDHDPLLGNRGLLTALIRPLFRFVGRSWHMFPLGFLFGLGFDTATEVAMFGVSVSQAAKGIPFEAIMVFPILFAAAMSLVDTTDGVVMIGAYNWARIRPVRKLYYNMTITLVSVAVALLIGGIEALGLIGEGFGLTGVFWDAIGTLNDNFNNLGPAIIGVFLIAWFVSYTVYKVKRIDEIHVHARV
jgi:high-affinity nickel-transport protein